MTTVNDAPVTIKGVCLDAERRVLLCRNHRGHWELPGGRPEVGESFPACLRREIEEETGLAITVAGLLDAFPYEVLPGRWVNVIVYACEMERVAAPVVSDEHDRVAFLDPASVSSRELGASYRAVIDAHRGG